MISRLKEIYEYRDMINSLVRRDLRGRYKGSYLGYLWNFANPLCQMLVYMVVFSFIFRSGIDNFPIYLLVGMIPWNFFSESICQGSGCIMSECEMVKKIYFPREVLPISTVTSRFVNFIISYLIVFLVILISGWGISLSLALIYLPIILFIQYVFVLAVTLFLSAVNVYFRDVEYMCGVFMMALIWGTPVMYSMEMVPDKLRFIIGLNPMTPIVCAYRDVLYNHVAPSAISIFKMFILSLVLLLVAEKIFIKLEERFAEEL